MLAALHQTNKLTAWIDEAPFVTRVLSTPWERARGWLLRRPAPTEQALLLLSCRAVHFWGTREPLDVFFLDATGNLLRHQRCTPWSPPLAERSATMVLEVASRFCPSTWSPRSVCLQNPAR